MDAGVSGAAAASPTASCAEAAAAFESSSAAPVDDDGLGSALGSHGVDAIASQLLGYANDLDEVLRRLDELGASPAATAAETAHVIQESDEADCGSP